MEDFSYESPLITRYASKELLAIFSKEKKYTTWRKLWVSLAEAQKKLGLCITEKQINELKENESNIVFSKVQEYEKKLRHEVMAHIHAYADMCPSAKGIIHLGATSSYVMDNADLIIYKEAMEHIHAKLLEVIRVFSAFAREHHDTPCVSYTHFQVATATTIGKRVCLWLQDLLLDANQIKRQIQETSFLGVKGATGTQDSFLNLFAGDLSLVQKLEEMVASDFGFTDIVSIASQTYPRKLDQHIAQCFDSLGASAHKISTDIRLLSHTKELYESVEKSQVGSSAMPYKKNPILNERVCSLARLLISKTHNASYNLALQWLERSLDDSANRRIFMPEMFLVADSILELLFKIGSNLKVDTEKTNEILNEHLVYLIQEPLLMQSVAKGCDRQTMHEKLRTFSRNAVKPNISELISFLENDPEISLGKNDVEQLISLNTCFGAANSQCLNFLNSSIKEVLDSRNNTPLKMQDLRI
ncbi:MAG: Adenylosuccinate lyase [Chlamydiia bacterium]|nr:Adenylosuccinate lyase [Chlamydiia bacterium]